MARRYKAMEKLTSRYTTAQAVLTLADEMDSMVKKYGWQDRTVCPWPGVKMTVADITRNMRGYSQCTTGSKLYLIDLANGLVDIMNAWEAYEMEPKLTIRSKKNGKVRTINAEIARELINEGYADAV